MFCFCFKFCRILRSRWSDHQIRSSALSIERPSKFLEGTNIGGTTCGSPVAEIFAKNLFLVLSCEFFLVLVSTSCFCDSSHFFLYNLFLFILSLKKNYSAIQVSRQVLARKVLGLKSVLVTPFTFLGTNLGPWRILFDPLTFSFS
jgi:hypothetical protein